jgi:glycosyltransferase involved in cell wall biosynthesis
VAERRLLIVEEALRDYVGHWYEYVRAVTDLARGDGVEVTIAGHAEASEALRDELGVVPVFEKTPWDGVYRRRGRLLGKLGLIRHNALVFRRMRAFLKARAPFDVTFVPTVFGQHVWAWRLLYLLYPRRIGRLVVLVRNNCGSYRPDSAEPRFNASARLFGWGLRSFTADVVAGPVTIATDSARLAEEYRRLTGAAPVVFPSPRIAAPPARKRRRQRAPLLFACLGPARFEKGIDILQRAIALYLADPANPPARFAMQWPTPLVDAGGDAYEPDPALVASGRVDVLTEPLDSDGYDALLAATDCMVLPYRRDAYFARISGVAVEAVTAGIPVIATADTWTGELVTASGAGLTVPDGDASALAAAMVELARDYSGFRRRAEAKRQAAAEAHSGAAFLTRLWGG